MTCHNCRIDTVKAGKQKDGSQRFKCQQCGKRYTEQKARMLGSDSRLPEEKALMILRCLLEGNSVRSTARLCDVEPNTVLNILVLAGERAERLLGNKLRNVPVRDVQADEIWSFIGCKEKVRTQEHDSSFGDCYTFVAIERDTKLVLNIAIGKRDQTTTNVFAEGLRQATRHGRFQLTTDGFAPYRSAIDNSLGIAWTSHNSSRYTARLPKANAGIHQLKFSPWRWSQFAAILILTVSAHRSSNAAIYPFGWDAVASRDSRTASARSGRTTGLL